jgi:CheY-like chemotaxis protein
MENKDIKILVAEDEAPIRRFIVKGLTCAGYLVQEAANGQEAWEKIAKDKPDLVVLDTIMPIMNGFELCRIMRDNEDTKNIPIIFCTALSPDSLDEKGVKADAYVNKSPEVTELLNAKIKELLDNRRESS